MKVCIFFFQQYSTEKYCTHLELLIFAICKLEFLISGTYFILYHYLNYFHHLKPTPVSYDRFLDIMNELFYDYNEDEREAIINKVLQYIHFENCE